MRIPFTLRYEDIKIGTGPEGEPGKVWHIKYTGWRASDGAEFDSWEDHRQLFVGIDGKPEFGPDGKPMMADPQPLEIPQGVGRVIPGFDWGIAGMRIGGKRRIFIPWQLAYGTHSFPDRPGHRGHSRQVRPHLRRGTGGSNRNAAAAPGRNARSASRRYARHSSRSYRARRSAASRRKRRTQRRARSTFDAGPTRGAAEVTLFCSPRCRGFGAGASPPTPIL